jgi:hypothetical protein
MTEAQSHRFHDVSIGYRCTSNSHGHYERKHVDILVERGDLVWVGQHFRIAAWVEERTWAKLNSGGMGVMQLSRGPRR